MRLLVVGYLEADSGKTSLTLSLIGVLKRLGLRAAAAKPVAGHSAWHQFRSVLRSMELGLLVGDDAYRLAAEAGMVDKLHLLNPVDLLITPVDPAKALGEVEPPLSIAAMRLTSGDGEVRHYVCPEVLRRAPQALVRHIERLCERLRPRPEPLPLAEALKILAGRAGREADRCVERLLSKFHVAVVESFNNAAAPTPLSLSADYVVAVGPGRVDLYSGPEYRREALRYAEEGVWLTLTVSDVVRGLKPLASFSVDPTYSCFEKAYEPASRNLVGAVLGVTAANVR